MNGVMGITFLCILSCIKTTIKHKIYHCGQCVKDM